MPVTAATPVRVAFPRNKAGYGQIRRALDRTAMIDLMPAAGHYLLIYDVSDDKERRLVEKAVKGFGFRVQKSAFECQLTKGWKTMLQKRLLGLNLRTGYAYLYRMAPNAQRWAVGVLPEQQPEVEEENFVYVA